MGHFKSKPRKKKITIKKKFFLFIIIMTILFWKIKIPKKYLNLFFNSFMQMKTNLSKADELVFKEDDNSKEYLVYIYSTHQRETYQTNIYDGYNIASTINFADNLLQEYLEDEGIYAIVQKSSDNTYESSRKLLEDAYKKNPTLKYFFDIHRDSGTHDFTTCGNYAKTLFVIGKENENYKQNEKFANILHTKLKSINSCLSRGILEKSGANVNGVYNQDFSENAILIEVGGEENYIEEVNETMKVLAKVITEYIKEENEA